MQNEIGFVLVGLFLLLIAGVGGMFLVQASSMHQTDMMMHGRSGHHGMMGSMHGMMHETSPERASEEQTQTAPNQNSARAGDVDEVFLLETDFQNGLVYSRKLGDDPESVTVNPTLRVQRGDRVKIKLVNNLGGNHDLAVAGLDVGSDVLTRRGAQTSFSFVASKYGTFSYYCTVPGHRSAGMEGKLIVSEDVD